MKQYLTDSQNKKLDEAYGRNGGKYYLSNNDELYVEVTENGHTFSVDLGQWLFVKNMIKE